jgi:HK97 family phage prohead protease
LEQQEEPNSPETPEQSLTRQRKEQRTAKEDRKALTREHSSAGIRALDGEGNERRFELSFSSEEPYARWWGIEILDHAPGAVDLTRLNEIGVLLFNHDRDEVLGRIERAWIDGDRAKAIVEFDSDEKADVIFQKVKSGTLKGVSVGYQIDSIEEVAANATSADGRFKGPCDVARKWTPYEISIVSVPADPTVGVGRAFDPEPPETPENSQKQAETGKHAPSLVERQLQINLNLLGGKAV